MCQHSTIFSFCLYLIDDFSWRGNHNWHEICSQILLVFYNLLLISQQLEGYKLSINKILNILNSQNSIGLEFNSRLLSPKKATSWRESVAYHWSPLLIVRKCWLNIYISYPAVLLFFKFTQQFRDLYLSHCINFEVRCLPRWNLCCEISYRVMPLLQINLINWAMARK